VSRNTRRSPATVTEALMTAHSRGESKLNTFVHDRLSTQTIGFHEKLKQLKSPTLTSMYHVQGKTTGVQKAKTVKADRFLFQRLLVSKDSGRDIDLKEVLRHELSPVPLSLADFSGQLRSTNKAALGQILQVEITTSEKPTDLRTCAIVDGQAVVQAVGIRVSMGTKVH